MGQRKGGRGGLPLFRAPTSPKVMRPPRAFSKLMAQSLHAVELHFGSILMALFSSSCTSRTLELLIKCIISQGRLINIPPHPREIEELENEGETTNIRFFITCLRCFKHLQKRTSLYIVCMYMPSCSAWLFLLNLWILFLFSY